VVQGAVNPDEFYVHKPALRNGKQAIIRRNLGSKLIRMGFASAQERAASGKLVTTVDTAAEQRNRFSLSDAEVADLARYALVIEQHYGRPMDIEWGKDGIDGKLYILQARPETVKSQARGKAEQRYNLKGSGTVLAEGRAIGQKIGTGPVRIVESVADIDRVQAGDVLVTDMTDPNWEPVMKRASAIVTNRGGRTCHAAIIARASSAFPRSSAAATRRPRSRTALSSRSRARKATPATSTTACSRPRSPRSSAASCRTRRSRS
jgi:pyruvate,water dikinase